MLYPDSENNGWVDKIKELSGEEHTELKVHICPVSHVLVKVCDLNKDIQCTELTKLVLQPHKLAFTLVNSTTILLSAWKACLEQLGAGAFCEDHAS